MAQATGMLLASEGSAGGKVWIGLKTVLRRECAVIATLWSVTPAPPVISTLLYFAIFGDILGKRIGSFGGVDYLHYVAPGAAMLYMVNAVRYGLSGASDVPIALTFSIMCASCIVLFLAAASLLARGKGIRD